MYKYNHFDWWQYCADRALNATGYSFDRWAKMRRRARRRFFMLTEGR